MFDFGKTLTLQGLLAVVIAMLLLSPAVGYSMSSPLNDTPHNHAYQIVFNPADFAGTDWVGVVKYYKEKELVTPNAATGTGLLGIAIKWIWRLSPVAIVGAIIVWVLEQIIKGIWDWAWDRCRLML